MEYLLEEIPPTKINIIRKEEVIIYSIIVFSHLLRIHQFLDKQKTLLSKDNKVLLASQERFELPTVRLEGVCSIRLSYWDMERVKRIELSTRAWKALVLPLNYTRICYFFPSLAPLPYRQYLLYV